jgi:DNA (cytosine-5)-methyltransferase 1
MIEYKFNNHKFPYKWNLSDGYPAKGINKNGLKVFGTFICGGGSTMGYKLAGYDHLGGVEIDPEVASIYKLNHNPKYLFNQDIREFNKLNDLPEELYNLDLLDGSPPCSTFSMAGSREKAWGKEKQFREGQSVQTLDDLVFEYCNTIIKLKPKVFLLENVKGIILGNAKAYSKKIIQIMEHEGYKVQLFLLNSASMGIPQRRERVFFIGYKKELNFKPLKLNFNEKPITYIDFKSNEYGAELTLETKKIWEQRISTDKSLADIHLRISGKSKRFNAVFIKNDKVPNTIAAGSDSIPIRFDVPHRITMDECKLIGSYPLDYNFKKLAPNYLIGMSVPPVMTAQIAYEIYLQWFKTMN